MNKFFYILLILAILAILGFIATLSFLFYPHWIDFKCLDIPYKFGGAISGAFSCLSLFGVLLTLKKQIEINEKQDEKIEKQQFETTFFNMMGLFQQIVADIQLFSYKIEYSKKNYVELDVLTKGRETFRVAYENTRVSLPASEYFDLYKKIEDSKTFERLNLTDDYIISYKGLKDIIEHFGIRSYESVREITVFDHYFRYLYRILKFVDKSTFLEINEDSIHERYKYTSILRGTLSRDELIWLFYNGLFFDKLKDLMEKYALLKNIREDLTTESLDAKQSSKKNDYDLLLTESIDESNSHKSKREKGEKVVPKYYKGAFFNEEELTDSKLVVKLNKQLRDKY